MTVKESQGRISENQESLLTEKGNFTQVPNEMLEYLMQADLTKRELRISLFLIRELTGWDFEYKPIELSDFVEGTKIPKQNIVPALETLVGEKGLVKKVKLPGYRTPLYGFNREIIRRVIAHAEPKKFFKAPNGKVIDLMTFKVIESMTLEVIESITEKHEKAKHNAALQVSKYILNTCKYNLREISEFLDTQKRQNKTRWETVISRILTDYPNDESLLWFAIELVNRTKHDLFGKPIKRSIIGLFEGDWQIMRVAAEAKSQQLEAEAAKAKKKEENEILYQETKNQEPDVLKAPVDISSLSPRFQRFARIGER